MFSYKDLHDSQYTSADIKELCLMRNDQEVQKYLNGNTFNIQDYSQTENWIRNKIEVKKIVLLSYVNEEFLGYCFAVDHDLGGSIKKGYEISFAIKRDFWNKGFTSQLIKKVINQAKSKGGKFLYAKVLSENYGCIKLLKKLSFEKVADFKSITLLNSDLNFYLLNI